MRQRQQEFQIGGTREEREGNRSNHCAGKVACLTNPVVTTARVVLLLTRALRVRLSARPSLRSLSCFEECDEENLSKLGSGMDCENEEARLSIDRHAPRKRSIQ